MQSGSILIIEDDQAIRETLRTALELEGYRIVTASNGQEAIHALTTLPRPCMILLDLMMPVMNGWEFAEALQKDPVLCSIPLVALTAFNEKKKKVSGVKKVLKKPIDLNTLIDTAKEYCGGPGSC